MKNPPGLPQELLQKLLRRRNSAAGSSRKSLITVIVFLSIMSFIVIYAGLFLFPGKLRDTRPDAGQSHETGQYQGGGSQNEDQSNNAGKNTDSGTGEGKSIVYRHLTEKINNLRQNINLLEVDVGRPGVKVMPVLSNDIIYGFEYLSGMSAGKNAYAAINGGFFTRYGLPSGMVAIDGQLITVSSGKYPVFVLAGGKASIMDIKSNLWVGYKEGRIKIDALNEMAEKGQTDVYTPVFGSDNLADSYNYTVTVINGRVVKAGYYKGSVDIPSDGYIISRFLTSKEAKQGTMEKEADLLTLNTGDSVKLIHDPPLPAGAQAYECGSWIIRNGRVVIGDRDGLVGVLTNRDPRTAIGVLNDGRVLLVTVDGRQPGFSEGMTGRELGEYMKGLGVKDAAMLDGGASTEMIVEGKLVSHPSFKGEERPLAGGILVFK